MRLSLLQLICLIGLFQSLIVQAAEKPVVDPKQAELMEPAVDPKQAKLMEAAANRIHAKSIELLLKKKNYWRQREKSATSAKDIARCKKSGRWYINAIRAGVLYTEGINIMSPEVGTFGNPVKGQTLRVMQVIDKSTMLVTPQGVSMSLHGTRTGLRQSFGKSLGNAMMIRGASTEGIGNGKTVEFTEGILEVTGTEEYVTVTGSTNTVFTIWWYSMESLDKAWKAKGVREKMPVEAPSKKKKHEFRTWSDDSGQHTVEARFSSYGNGKVTLEKEDGSKVILLVERLSEKDQEWLKEL